MARLAVHRRHVLSFVLFGHYGGLAPATFASVFISAFGDRQNSVRDAALLSLLMVVAGYLIFSLGLHLQFATLHLGLTPCTRP